MSVRSALVTGATRGIGRGVATSLARQGFGLTITARDEAALVAEAARLRAEGSPAVVHVAADMADHEALPHVVAQHKETHEAMSALVLNAGVGTAGAVGEVPLRRVKKTFDVNVTAAFVLIQESLPLLRGGAIVDPARGATVVALASITGVHPEPGLAAYGASKAALLSLVETLTLEEAEHGVRATAVAPGYVDTDMSAWTTDTVPADTMIRVDDVVRVIDLLVGLGATTAIPRIVMARTGAGGRGA